MNVISVPAVDLTVLSSQVSHGYNPDVKKFLDLSWLTLDNYAIKGYAEGKTVFADYFIEVIDRDDLPVELVDLSPNVNKVIHYINFFDKKNPMQNLNDLQHQGGYIAIDDVFTSIELFIAVQIAEKDGFQYMDLYAEPSDKCADSWMNFTEDQMTRRAIFPLVLLDYLEWQFKKSAMTLKKKMPTPEEIKTIETSGKPYQSRPIVINDLIKIQYIYDPHKARKYNRYCEAWGVRGHYRHYKNGKVIFVRPHTKGVGRLKDTEYVIKKEDRQNETV